MSSAPQKPASEPCGLTPRERRMELRLAGACLAWGLCFVGARLLIKYGMVSGSSAWVVGALPSVAGAMLVAAFTRYLREVDELQRTIQLQALALGFGGGFLAICGYATFEQLGAPAVDPGTMLAIMPVLYAIGTLIGWRRYR